MAVEIFTPFSEAPPEPVLQQEDIQRIVHVLDFDELFRNSHDKIILNRFDFTSPNYPQQIAENIFSRASDIDFVARCECEHLQGNFYIGQVCPKCNTPVTMDMEAATGYLQHRAWIECPKDVKGWLNPSAFFVLSRWLSYGKRVVSNYTNAKGDVATKGKIKKGNYLEDILDPNPNIPLPEEIQGAVTGKGFNYFYDNFDYLMDYFINSCKKTAIKKDTVFIARYIQKHRDIIFCRYFPVLSSSLHAVVMSEGAKDNRKRYVDKICQYVQDAAHSLSYIEFSPRRNKTITEIEDNTFSAYQNIIAYTSTIARKHLSEKRAIPRMHVFGSRLHLSGRAVIVPIAGRHKCDELHFPWGLAVNMFRVDLIGVMMRQHGMTLKEAYNRQQHALIRYDSLIHQLLIGFIEECPYPGIPILLNRNPSIHSGSIMLLWFTKVKTDPEDETIGVSVVIVAPWNADFDGDKCVCPVIPKCITSFF